MTTAATLPGHEGHEAPMVCLTCLRRDVRLLAQHHGHNVHRCGTCRTDYVTMPYPPPHQPVP